MVSYSDPTLNPSPEKDKANAVPSIKFTPLRYVPKYRLGEKGSTRNESLVVQLENYINGKDVPLSVE